MTLDDASSLLHLPIEGMVVAHEGSMPRIEAVEMMDQLDLANVIMSLYVEHRQTCPFKRVILYYG